jgi:hypothetical protein
MSYWNYRVIRKHHKESDTNTYQIHEVYYLNVALNLQETFEMVDSQWF